MTAIFISHSSKDNKAAVALKAWLEDQGHTSLFLDFDPEAGIKAGTAWEQVLYHNLRQCQAVIALLSPHWLASKWCFAEIAQARAQGKPVFPVRIAACDGGAVLADIQHIDLTASPQEGYRRLAIGLKERGLDPAAIFDWKPNRPPYPGLHAFDEADAAVFFGRTDEITRAHESLDRLRRLGREAPHFVLVVGASGSGKSSLIRAGLIPRLRKDADLWLPVRPFRPQDKPLEGLALALAEMFAIHQRPRDWQDILSKLKEAADQTPPDSQALIKLAYDMQIAAGHCEATLLLCLDQAEELFAQSPEREATRFLGLLRAGLECANQQLMALATLRSDFLGRFQIHPVLNDKAYDHNFAYETLPMGPMPVRHVPQVIVGPAKVCGLELEPGLAEMMVKDMETEDALPLLAYTLRSLWDKHGDDDRLTINDYVVLGRLEGSVRTAAEQELRGARPTDDQLAALRGAFVPAMVRLGETGQYFRRRAFRDELPRGADSLLNRLVNARLLITDRDQQGRETIEVAHEALLRTWPQLAGWLKEDRDKLHLDQTLRYAAREWKDSGCHADLLVHRDGRLQEIQALTQEQRFALAGDTIEKAYLNACLRAQRSRERLRRRITHASLAAAAVMAVLLVATTWLWIEARNQREEAERQKTMAVAASYEARSQRDATLRTQSRILADLSQQRTEAGDATTGILLALARLPSEHGNGDQPHAAEVEGALYAAVQAHQGKHILPGSVTTAQFSPDGQRVVTVSRDGTARLWDAASGQERAVLRGRDGRVIAAAFSPDGQRVLTTYITASGGEGVVQLWDAANGTSLAVLRDERNKKRISSAQFSPDGQRVLTVSEYPDHTVQLWDAARGTSLAVLRQEKGVTSADQEKASRVHFLYVAFSPDGQRVLTVIWTSEYSDNTARLWDAASGQEQAVLRGHEDRIISAAFSPDGQRVVTASTDKTARLWDAASGQEQAVLRGHEGVGYPGIENSGIGAWEVQLAAFSPDGQRVVTASRYPDNTARLWDAASGQEQAVLRGHEREVLSAAFSPDGQRVVTVSRDGTARLWDAASGQEQAVLRGRDGRVIAAAFSPDGQRVLTTCVTASGGEGVVQLWDAASGQEQAVLRSHQGPVHSAAVRSAVFSPDGQRILTVSQDDTARLWRVFATTQELIEYAKSIVPRALMPDQRRQFFLEESAPEDGPAIAPPALPAPALPAAADPPG